MEALASFETLNAEILASRSATRTLAAWCALHRLAPDPKIRAIRVPNADAPVTEIQRERLQIGPTEPVHHRRVRLSCGTHVLSEADNWFVPSRLTADMNKVLDTTDTPFGLVVADLHPTRETFDATVLWRPLPPNWQEQPPPPDHPDQTLAIPPILFEHHALLYDSAHRPISEVDERYTRDVLSFDGGPKELR